MNIKYVTKAKFYNDEYDYELPIKHLRTLPDGQYNIYDEVNNKLLGKVRKDGNMLINLNTGEWTIF
jgi:hypothetical protein